MVNDPIGDLIAQIKNATMARKSVIEVPYSKMKMAVVQILQQEGYISAAEKIGTQPKFRLRINLRYRGRTPVVTDFVRKSKPGLRVYVNRYTIPNVVGGMGIAIISTSQGVMTGKEAKKRGLGGEVLCEIW